MGLFVSRASVNEVFFVIFCCKLTAFQHPVIKVAPTWPNQWSSSSQTS